MRIGYYIPGWPPGMVPNGIVTTLGHLGQSLREQGHDVFYITPHLVGESVEQNVFVMDRSEPRSLVDAIRFKWNFEKALYNKHSIGVAAAVKSLCVQHKLDIFQMEETQGWVSAVIRQAPIPVVVRLHGPWHLNRELGLQNREKDENRHRIAREGDAIFSAAAVTAPSNNVLSLTEEFYGKVLTPAEVIPNPISIQPQGKRWKLEECDRDLVLFIGRFDKIKGADLALKAFSEVARTKPELKLLFVGPDIGMKSEYGVPMKFDDFVRKEIPPFVRERIRFAGQLHRKEIDRLRVRARVTLVASRYETFGNVVIEAMAFGCPIVATDVGGISEILTDGRNGLMVPARAEEMGDALMRMLVKPEVAAELGLQAAIDCGNRFDPQKIAQRTVDFYSSVIDRNREGLQH